MLESDMEMVKKDMNALVKDAQELFQAASSLTGEKADDLRNRGLKMLDVALEKAQRVQDAALRTGKDVAISTDDYVHENPWAAVAVATGVGFLIGYLLGRK